MMSCFRRLKADPFGPDKFGSDKGDILGGAFADIVGIFKNALLVNEGKKKEKEVQEDKNKNDSCNELWRWLREESYKDEYEVYHAPYFINEVYKKWEKEKKMRNRSHERNRRSNYLV